MKKVVGALVCLAMCMATAGAFAGCGDGPTQGALYSLSEAYDNGWLTQDDLLSIAYYHNGGRELNEELMPEDYTPQSKTPETLSAATELGVINAVEEVYRENDWLTEHSVIKITEYCGTYGGCVVFMAWDINDGCPLTVWQVTVDGVVIFYRDMQSIAVWKE